IHGIDTNHVWAVGLGRFSEFNGSAWNDLTSPTGGSIRGVWAASADDIWIVGDGGVLFHWDGSTWENQSGGVNYTSVWGASSNNVWITGDAGTLRYLDGGSWTIQNPRTTATIRSIAGADQNTVFAVGDAGLIRQGTQ